MSTPLTNLIHQIRAATSIEEENHVISTELANIRTIVRNQPEPDSRARIIAKLCYLNMLEQPTSFGQLECINLMSDDRFSYKRIGYLGAGLLMDETQDTSVLLTHCMQKDLQSKHRFVVSLALALLANIGSLELCRSLAADVSKILDIDDPFLRKRAAMAVIRIIKKVPDLVDNFHRSVHKLLNDPSHSVVLSGIGMVIEMIKVSPALAERWGDFAPSFVKILRSLQVSYKSAEESSDPFLQVKVLEILSLLGKKSDDLDETLTSIITTADQKRSEGRAVLLQAVQTVVKVGKKPQLRVTAFSQIGHLLSFSESNVLYSALNVFSKVLYANRDILERDSSDALALQRYKAYIVRCLDNPDVSIRRRALDVISALIDKSNVERLVPEILKYLHLADPDFRMELIGRVFSAIQRFSPNDQWNFNSILKIMKESGGYVKNDIITEVCKVVSCNEAMKQYAISQLQPALTENATVQPLVQVASWILGEYGTMDQQLKDTFGRILTLPQTTKETKAYIYTAVAKLLARAENDESAKVILAEGAKDNDLDLQQRSGEYLHLLSCPPEISSMILSPDPPISEQEAPQQNATTAPSNLENWQGNQPVVQEQKDDLLDLLGDFGPAPTPTPVAAPSMVQTSGPALNPYEDDLLSTSPVPSKPTSSTARDVFSLLD